MTTNANASSNAHKEGYLSCTLFMLNTPGLYALMQWVRGVCVNLVLAIFEMCGRFSEVPAVSTLSVPSRSSGTCHLALCS